MYELIQLNSAQIEIVRTLIALLRTLFELECVLTVNQYSIEPRNNYVWCIGGFNWIRLLVRTNLNRGGRAMREWEVRGGREGKGGRERGLPPVHPLINTRYECVRGIIELVL